MGKYAGGLHDAIDTKSRVITIVAVDINSIVPFGDARYASIACVGIAIPFHGRCPAHAVKLPRVADAAC